MEETLVILKPDALTRGLIGLITSRLEQKGLQLTGCKMIQLSHDDLQKHYQHLADKPFFPRIAEFMASRPVIVQCWRGVDAVDVVRTLAGITNGRKAPAGTIRGDFSMSVQCNLLHASDSGEAAKEERQRFFNNSELFGYDRVGNEFLYARDEA